MEQYILKSALVAEIERRIKSTNNDVKIGAIESLTISKTLNSLIFFIDTLEVKEVDLEKEIRQHINDCLNIKFPTTDIKMIAKDVEYTARKFFELGLKAQKGE